MDVSALMNITRRTLFYKFSAVCKNKIFRSWLSLQNAMSPPLMLMLIYTFFVKTRSRLANGIMDLHAGKFKKPPDVKIIYTTNSGLS